MAWINRSKVLHVMHRNTEALECSEKGCEENPFWDQVSMKIWIDFICIHSFLWTKLINELKLGNSLE